MNILLVNAEAIRTPLADESVHCAASSPPYYGLRKYAGKKQVRDWPEVSYAPMPGLPPLTIPAMRCALGNERTPEAFIGHLVLCYREVKRVLRDDGVAWVVIGDSHNSNASNQQRVSSTSTLNSPAGDAGMGRCNKAVPTLHQGDLLGIPARLMFALQADGWICRNENVWHKKAPMPSSIFGTYWERHRLKVKSGRYDSTEKQAVNPTGAGLNQRWRGEPGWAAEWEDCPGCPKCQANDGYVLRRGSWRHTRAHETVLMLTKKMHYWADQEAVREAISESYVTRWGGPNERKNCSPQGQQVGSVKGESTMGASPAGRNPRDVLTADATEELWLAFLDWMRSAGPGDVLTPRPESYSGDHYAVYPTSLLEPLLKAGCPERCCPKCGAGWAPVVERGEPQARPDNPNPALPYDAESGHTNGTGATTLHKVVPTDVLGYRPTCACHTGDPEPPWLPGVVFDPFVGSGSTLIEALAQGKRAIGADLSAEYLDRQARARLELDLWSVWHGMMERHRDGKEQALAGLPLFAGLEG